MVELIPMAEKDYQHFLAWAVEDYAQEQIKAGAWSLEEAIEKAEKAFDQLLPCGHTSQNQFFYSIRQVEEEIGYLWFGIREPEGDRFVGLHELLIFDEYRRQGYASKALARMEEKIIEMGINKIMLHVFGHNDGARALYQKLGYEERNVTMVKELGGGCPNSSL
jgi:ribosomal protein S18 acetylase RimI-like enzyme